MRLCLCHLGRLQFALQRYDDLGLLRRVLLQRLYRLLSQEQRLLVVREQLCHLLLLLLAFELGLLTRFVLALERLQLKLNFRLCSLHFLELRLLLRDNCLLLASLRLQLSDALLHAIDLLVQLFKLVILLFGISFDLLQALLGGTRRLLCNLF